MAPCGVGKGTAGCNRKVSLLMVAHVLHLAAAKAFLFALAMIDYGSELFRWCDVGFQFILSLQASMVLFQIPI